MSNTGLIKKSGKSHFVKVEPMNDRLRALFKQTKDIKYTSSEIKPRTSTTSGKRFFHKTMPKLDKGISGTSSVFKHKSKKVKIGNKTIKIGR